MTVEAQHPESVSPTAEGLLVTRRPILTRERAVFGYQLCLETVPMPDRPPARSGAEPVGGSVTDALERCGLDTLTFGRPVFLRASASKLGPAVREAFPPGRVVVEVPGDRQVEADVLDECRALREAGYAVALDDFQLSAATAPLVPLADYLKVDFLPSTSAHTQACIEAGRRGETALVATHVDAMEVLEEAAREGFTYFQGGLFEQRRTSRAGVVPPGQLVYLQLLQALSDPNLSVGAIEEIVKRDAALAHHVLQLANSAAFAQRREVTSMRHALMLVGRDTVRRWASLAIVNGLGRNQPDELIVMATVRARFCELLGLRAGGEDFAGPAFLVGLCSLLDVILERPMRVVLDELPLTAEVSGALLGRDNPCRRLLECALAYEHGDWSSCLALAEPAGLEPRSLTPAYIDALRFAYEVRQ